MKKLFVMLVLLCVSCVVHAEEWSIDEFMIYGSWPFSKTVDDEARAKVLADADINCVLAEAHHLDMLGKYGIRGFVEHVKPKDIGKIKNHSALYGYYIMDEPLHNIGALKKIYDEYYRADPTKPGFINLISLGGKYLTEYMETVQPRILSYDYYQYWWGIAGHFTKLEQYSRAADKADVPWFLYTEVNSSPYGTFGGPKNVRPENNEARVRQSVFTALAYGLDGVLWFTAGQMFEKNSAELNDIGHDIARINADLKVLGPTLIKLKHVDTYHTAPLERDVTEIPADYWLQPYSYRSYGVCMGTFKDENDIDYVMLSNKNTDIEMSVALEIARRVPVKAVHRLDKKSGKWVELPVTEMVTKDRRHDFSWAYDMHEYSSRTGGYPITYKDVRDKFHVEIEGRQFVEFELDRGDGELLRITRDMSYETIRQQKSPSEKF